MEKKENKTVVNHLHKPLVNKYIMHNDVSYLPTMQLFTCCYVEFYWHF